MNNNRLVACVGFFMFVLSLIAMLTKSTVDMSMCFLVGLALMAGGVANEALGG